MSNLSDALSTAVSRGTVVSRLAYEAYRILQFVFVIAPILAGLDKLYLHVMGDWARYLNPAMPGLTHMPNATLLMLAGIIEIVIGLGVALKPRYFGYIVALWLGAVIINLLSMGMYYDVIMRDMGLAVAAIAMARLAGHFDHGPFGGLYTRNIT